ncbi:MAG: thiol reductant ABC exporter subunit CydC [Alphaproteobacteria bacterium]
MLIWRLLQILSPYKFWIAGGIVMALASTLANIALMAVSGWFITAMGIAGVTGAAINYFTPASLIRACAIVRTSGRYGERLLTHEATFHIIARLRRWFYDHLEPLAPAVLMKQRSGELFGRLRGDIDVLERFYLNFIVPASVAFFSSIIIVCFVYLYHPVFAVIFLFALCFCGGLLPFLNYILSRESERDIVNLIAQMRASLTADLQGIGELLVYDSSQQYKHSDEALYKSIQAAQDKALNVELFVQNLAVLGINICMVIILYFAAILAQYDVIGYPNVVMLVLLTMASYEAVQPLIPASRHLGGILRAAQRIFDIVDQELPVRDSRDAKKSCDRFSLCFDHVTYGYEADYPVLRDLSFDIGAGDRVLVVGPSGAGKSTLIHLMLRFSDPQQGRIVLGNNALTEYDGASVRSCFSVVSQRPYIFDATVRQNLLVANALASPEDLDDACKKAGIYDFILDLPAGYDSYVGENGRQLSGGQIKRLALARAFLKDALCLILDESGEGLDYKMEHDILQRVIELPEGKALIYITHRRGLSGYFDKIISLP